MTDDKGEVSSAVWFEPVAPSEQCPLRLGSEPVGRQGGDGIALRRDGRSARLKGFPHAGDRRRVCRVAVSGGRIAPPARITREAIMRIVLLLAALAFATPTLTACTTANPNSRVYQTMNNQPNVCGKGFKRDIDAC